ncbi:MAG: hypothetical protein HQK96_01825 [Nitrospirae bacterium]|nr:hypothetical protein [Nitrospirota bacterium]
MKLVAPGQTHLKNFLCLQFQKMVSWIPAFAGMTEKETGMTDLGVHVFCLVCHSSEGWNPVLCLFPKRLFETAGI